MGLNNELELMCMCDAYSNELHESAKLIWDALRHDATIDVVWDRKQLIELISEYKQIKQQQFESTSREGSV